MRRTTSALTPRVALGSALLGLFIAIVFIALLGTSSSARKADRAERSAARLTATATEARMAISRAAARERGATPGDVTEPALKAARMAEDGAAGVAGAAGLRAQTEAYLSQPNAPRARRLDAALASVAEAQEAAAERRSDALSGALRRNIVLGLVGVAGALLTLLALGADLVNTVVRPVRRLALAARRFRNGDLSARVPETGGPHMAALAGSLNEMAASFEKTRTELAQRLRELDQARLDADRGNEAKSEFLSRMSHELRTPLNAILGFAQLLEMDDLDARQRDNVAHIVSGGRHLLDLINEVLEISRIEVGTMSPSIEPVHAATTLSETIELVSPLAAQRKVELKMSLGTLKDTWIEADQQRLKQVLLNLLANAVKYNREEGSVTVSFRRMESRLRILVTDTGQGIPQDQIPKLFIPFERLGAESTGVEGTGLGLVLVQRLMEAMGGTIGVESQPWIGSTFHIEFPIAQAPEPVEEPEARPRASRVGVPVASGGQLRALYIEDDNANVRLMSHVFQSLPECELITTMQGKLGIELARQHQPDLILLDIGLPDIDGTEVMRRLRADDLTSRIPVIVVSANATEDQIRRVKLLGAVRYLTKPLDLELVMSAVREVLAGGVEAAAAAVKEPEHV